MTELVGMVETPRALEQVRDEIYSRLDSLPEWDTRIPLLRERARVIEDAIAARVKA